MEGWRNSSQHIVAQSWGKPHHLDNLCRFHFCQATSSLHYFTTSVVQCDNNRTMTVAHSLTIFKRLEIASIIREWEMVSTFWDSGWWWFSHEAVSDPCDPWTTACKDCLSTGFSRQEYWSGLSFPSPVVLSDPGIKPRSPDSRPELTVYPAKKIKVKKKKKKNTSISIVTDFESRYVNIEKSLSKLFLSFM